MVLDLFAQTALLLSATLLQAAPAQNELERLQGTWAVVSNTSGDGKTDEEYNRRDGYRVIIKGTNWGWRSESAGDHDVTFRLDPTQKPKQLDLDLQDGKNKCIYEVDGDHLRVCIAHFGQPRPDKFAASSNASLVVLRRVKQ